MNIWLLLDVASSLDPDRRILSDARTSFTLAQLRRAAISLANQLTSLETTGPLAFVGVNSVAFPISLFGAALAGRAFAPLNYRADAALMAHFFDVLQPACVVADDRYTGVLPRGMPLLHMEDAANVEEPPTVDEHGAAAVFVFTSGTAARPKAVQLRHPQLSAYVLNSAEPLQEPPEASSLIAAPNYHIAALANVLTSTYSGRRMVLLDEFTPERWLDAARRESVSHAFVVPTMLHRIVEYLGYRPADLAWLRTLAYGGAPTPRRTIEAALRAFPSTGFVNAYGLTETSSTVTILGPEDHRLALESDEPAFRDRLSSVGRALPGVEVRIAPDGEVLVRGDQVSSEYINAGAQMDRAGWFHTGDMGRMDSEGYLYLLGRTDDLIIRGGENVSPVEVETVLRQYPGVRDAAVVGLPDEEWGQRLAAVVETDQLDDAAMVEWTHDRLPSFKRPSTYLRVDSLPRNDLGKVLRRVLREQLLR